MGRELRLRILSGIVLAAVVLAATWYGDIAFRLLAAVIALLIYYEWSTITRLPETDFRGNAFGWASTALVAALVVFRVDEFALPLLLAAVAVGIVYALALKGSGWLAGGIA
jgi:phosphatidate cytidylyltransferase